MPELRPGLPPLEALQAPRVFRRRGRRRCLGRRRLRGLWRRRRRRTLSGSRCGIGVHSRSGGLRWRACGRLLRLRGSGLSLRRSGLSGRRSRLSGRRSRLNSRSLGLSDPRSLGLGSPSSRLSSLPLLSLAPSGLFGLAPRLLLGLTPLALEPCRLFRGDPHTVRLGDDAADCPRDRRARADRVVVAGDHVVDPVRVAVGVDQADDRDSQPLRLAHRDRLGLEVDHEHRLRNALHVLDAAEVRLQLLEVLLGGDPLAGRQQLQLTLRVVALEVVKALDPQRDRLEVGQQAAEPAVVDVRHAGRVSHLLDHVAGLLLGADEQDRAAATGDVGRELAGLFEQLLSLQEVDDVDAVPLAEDEAAHLWIPAARLVTEVNAGLQQLPDADLSHGATPFFCLSVDVRPPAPPLTSHRARQGTVRPGGVEVR